MICKDAAPLRHRAVGSYYVAVNIVELPLGQGYAGIRAVTAYGIQSRSAGKDAHFLIVDVYLHK